jgi:hypothetical protein
MAKREAAAASAEQPTQPKKAEGEVAIDLAAVDAQLASTGFPRGSLPPLASPQPLIAAPSKPVPRRVAAHSKHRPARGGWRTMHETPQPWEPKP